jgi:hypothetical protein
MRLRKEMIARISAKVVERLLGRELLETEMPEAEFIAKINRLIEEDLLAEDRLNDEVKEILRDHQDEMDQGNVDYSRMFSMVKTRLARERNLVL